MLRSQVGISKCKDYDRVEEAVRSSVELIGGIGSVVLPGQKVVVKPNLLCAAPPEAAITTHPAVVEAVVKLVVEAGGEAIIADSPGTSIPYIEKGLKRIYRATGMEDVAERRGARLNFDTSVSEVPYPEASVAKRLEIIRPALEADLVINVPKLKTHVYTTFSGAVKNLFGLVPGYTKAGYHAKFNNLIYFSKMLLDIFNFVRPALNVMDGVVALEGDGPGWHGHPRKVGVVMASLDGLALDVAACRLVGIHPERVPTLEIAREQGLVDFEGIEIKGCQEKFVGFKMPSVCRDPAGYVQSGFFRSFVHPVLISMLTARPVPIEDRCSGCGTCLSACPRGAIEVRGGVAVVDHDLCIRCYCCHELCPYAAIDLRTSWLGRLLRRTGVMGRWSRGEISQ